MSTNVLRRAIVAACALLAVGMALPMGGWRVWYVHAYATLAEHLAEGHGPVWFPGAPRVEGFTNPLWVGVLAALHGLPGVSDDRLGGYVVAVNVALFAALAAACARLLGGRTGLALALVPGTLALPFFAAEGFEVGHVDIGDLQTCRALSYLRQQAA